MSEVTMPGSSGPSIAGDLGTPGRPGGSPVGSTRGDDGQLTARSGASGSASAPSRPVGASVTFKNLRRTFGATVALDDFSLDIEPGELLALLGPSGCGKTTALRVLAGFDRPDAGEVLLDGRDIAGVPASKRDMGMVFQSYSLFPTMSALDNVAFGLRLRGDRGPVRRKRAAELLDLVGLSEHARRYPHQLSGGQQQRVALARALAIEPQVLLLDEPLSALDAKVRNALRDEIRALQQRLGTTTLFVTHDQEEALSIADRVGVMRAGRLEQVAAPTGLYDNPASAFVAGFVGTMNRVSGLCDGSGRVSVLGTDVNVAHPPVSAGPVQVLVRPEALAIVPDGTAQGIVVTKSFRGPVTRLSIQLPDQSPVWLDLASSAAHRLSPGDTVRVRVTAQQVLTEPAVRTAQSTPESS